MTPSSLRSSADLYHPVSLGRRVAVVLLLLCGVAIWRTLGEDPWHFQHLALATKKQLFAAGILAALGLIPAVHRAAYRGIERLRHSSPTGRRLTMLAVALLGGGYLTFTAFHQHRILGPQWHDEHSYLIQMQMLRTGRLWMPSHPLGEFFETFHVLNNPAYASKYFPGASILLMPTVWFHLPYGVMPVLLSSLALMMTYRVLAELIDGGAGVLAGFMLLSLLKFRMVSTMTLSQIPLLLMALLTVWAWLHWRRNKKVGWAILIGLFAGFGALTRPLDTVCYVLPIGVAMLFDLSALPMKRRVATVLLIVAAAAPFLGIQLLCNQAIAGHWAQTPWAAYSRQSDPWDTVGPPKVDPAQPLSTLPQKVTFREQLSRPFAEHKMVGGLIHGWRYWRVGRVLESILPAAALIFLIPVAIPALRDRRRLVLAATLPLMIAAYTFHTFFNEYYFVAVAPAAAMLVLLGARQIEAAWPRFRPALATAMAFAIIGLSVAALPEITRGHDEFWHDEIFAKVDAAIAGMEHKPAVVLFRFDPSRRIDAEPVYNTDVARIDDAPVIRAHDRGEDNVRLFRYYAPTQPNRAFYRYDEATGEMEFLGEAKDLAAR